MSEIDLGGTTPDPGHIEKVSLDGTGRYTTGTSANQLNNNGVVTLEYINSPGQFFVIEDIDGGVFGPGDRQGFGLVRETIVDRTDLDGGPGVFDGGNSGGWSWQYTWYYTGGFPYCDDLHRHRYPGGSGGGLGGAMPRQTDQRDWWYSMATGVGKNPYGITELLLGGTL